MSDNQKKLGGASTMSLSGRVTISIRNAITKKLVRRMQSSNLIVGDGIIALLYMIAQNTTDPAPSTFAVASLRLGTGTTPPNDGDKNLETEMYAVNLTDSDKLVVPASREIVFSHLLTSSDGNGPKYAEAALVMADASLPAYSKVFARYTHPPFTKTVDNEALYEWHIGIRAASNT